MFGLRDVFAPYNLGAAAALKAQGALCHTMSGANPLMAPFTEATATFLDCYAGIFEEAATGNKPDLTLVISRTVKPTRSPDCPGQPALKLLQGGRQF